MGYCRYGILYNEISFHLPADVFYNSLTVPRAHIDLPMKVCDRKLPMSPHFLLALLAEKEVNVHP